MGNIDYQRLELPYRTHDQDDARHFPLVVVGAGPVGLSLALDHAQRGHKVVVIDDSNRLSTGSRAICFSKRALDIWDRLGVAERMVRKGVSWHTGKVFFRNQQVWQFDLLPETGHRRPAFINLQQYYCEGYLYEAAREHPNIELRWKHKAIAVRQDDSSVSVTIETPDGIYTLDCDWLLACDGARSSVRKMIGQESRGRVFHDRFLITDVKMDLDYPPERWFWFDPPFHPNQSVLLHSQPDNVWRVDFQLGRDADPAEEVRHENVIPRIQALLAACRTWSVESENRPQPDRFSPDLQPHSRAMGQKDGKKRAAAVGFQPTTSKSDRLLGKDIDFDIEWISVYTFACERMERFRHGRIIFAGDSAYRVSPFGARGANSGIEDADNLAWKLDLVMRGQAPDSLIDTYCEERSIAADENLMNSSRSTDFITPKSEISLLFRNTTLTLAEHHEFARALVNSGRLSKPVCYAQSRLNTPDQDTFNAVAAVGAAATDAPVTVLNQHDDQADQSADETSHTDWWLSQMKGNFVLAVFCDRQAPSPELVDALQRLQSESPVPLDIKLVLSPALTRHARLPLQTHVDHTNALMWRYDAHGGACYLIRPDQHIAARWRDTDPAAIRSALKRATAASD